MYIQEEVGNGKWCAAVCMVSIPSFIHGQQEDCAVKGPHMKEQVVGCWDKGGTLTLTSTVDLCRL